MARPRRILALAAAAGAGAALAACSLLAGLDADYTLQASAGAEGGRDGDGPPDGGFDTSADTSVTPDGPLDAGADARFCANHRSDPGLVYCCDFEPETDCAWNASEATGGTIADKDGIGRLGSRGLHATVAKPPASLYLRRERGAAFNAMSKHELSFAFAVKTKSSLYGAALGALGFGLPLKVIGVSVYKATGKDGIDVSDPPGTLTGSSEYVEQNEWRRATITMIRTDGGPTTTSIKVTKAGQTSETEVDSRVGYDGGAGLPEILVGAFFTSPEQDGGVETVIDDILFIQTK